ncbi:MAG: UDP-N-acetylmuramoyl-L-alanine--D-glutamate ligase [Candidatus Pacebacteria bacterium]|nr:UDP-N-acetylmuramoyl-L-alanine--D-glutamate ligase [Candidatus Paceibacterota bacterium]
MDLKFLENKSVLILGLGREGEATFRLLRKNFPEKIIYLADQNEFRKLPIKLRRLLEKDGNAILCLGKNYLESVKNVQIIFKTPGIPEKTLSPYLNSGINVFSQMEIFLKEKRNNCIGITGTKGKSTTSSLIYHILKNSSFKSKLIGNIGKPVFSYLQTNKKERFVIELSSHQLNRVQVSPHIAVFLNIFREHLDYYNNFNEYFQAKQNIFKWQTKDDYLVYNSDFQQLKNLAKQSGGHLVSFGFEGRPKIQIKDDWIRYANQKIVKREDIPLKGEHNILNVMAAIAVAKILRIPNRKIAGAIKTFKPLKHRMELFANYNGIDFYNDSIATIPEATIQMINSIPNINTLILGGLDRGQDFKSLAERTIQKKIKNIILLPENHKRIAKAISKTKGRKPKIYFAKNMKEVAHMSFKNTKGGACVLSPASASYNLFKNFEERGNRFKKIIKDLIKNGKND